MEKTKWSLGFVNGELRELVLEPSERGVVLREQTPSRPFVQIGNYGFSQEQVTHAVIVIPGDIANEVGLSLINPDRVAALERVVAAGRLVVELPTQNRVAVLRSHLAALDELEGRA